uniref:Transposase (Putative), gypsy type n=1 Tax=Tanacetum cinerariifolium TaxID=118510 RepID=A0A6L2J1H6_TANCI|nr:hypothetical protein [Tanacetum cinerariifolium]
MDYEQLLAEFNVRVARQICFNDEIRMRLEHELRGRQRFEERYALQVNRLKERDAEIASLKTQLSLKEAEAAEEIHLRCQIANIEDVEAARVDELKVLKENNVALKRRVAALESAAASKDVELASSNSQVSELETTCFGLQDEVMGYKLFKERVEEMHDEQVKVLSDRVAGRRWILSRGLKLAIMKCLQSPEYMAALGGALGRAIDKGMQEGLKAGVDHGRVERGLNVIAAYDLSAKSNFVFAVDTLCPATKISKASQLQPFFEQLMVPIHRLKDQVIIGESSLSFALDVAQSRVQRIKGDVAACRLSLTDAMVMLFESLSVRSLTGEASTSKVPFVAVTTALLTTFIQTSTIPSLPSAKVPPSPKIVFEEEELNTTPKHTSAPYTYGFCCCFIFIPRSYVTFFAAVYLY